MALKHVTKLGIQLACDEFDRIGLHNMLEKYGGGRSVKWFLRFKGRPYDQKLILRAAQQHQGLGPLPPGPSTFTAQQTRHHLEKLGYEVVAVGKTDTTPTSRLDHLKKFYTESLTAAREGGFITFDEHSFLEFDEEELANFEVGVKGSLLDNRLQLAAAIYVMDWEKMIQPVGFNWDDPSWNTGDFDPQGRVFAMSDTMAMGFLNVGNGDLSGIEVEANFRANENWTFRGAAAIASAEFAAACLDDPVNDFGYTPTLTTAQGAPYDCYEVAGRDLPQQPDTTLSLARTYTAQLGAGGWDWSARLGVRYADTEFHDVLNLTYLPATTIVNGSVTLRNDNWNMTLFGNNLTDDDTARAINFGTDNNQTPSGPGFSVRPRIPREVGARLSYQF